MSNCVAMHMGNELLNPTVAFSSLAAVGLVLGWLSRRAGKRFSAEKVPLMGVLGAFVFAAQMINFQLPGLGTSGHMGGGVLLAILLGPEAATLVMAAILIVQCLVFQDGGLLALGCNIINMGLVPCFVGWGVFRAIAGPLRSRPGPADLPGDLVGQPGRSGGRGDAGAVGGRPGRRAGRADTQLRGRHDAAARAHRGGGGAYQLRRGGLPVPGQPRRAGPAACAEARTVRAGRKVVIASLLAAAIVTAGAPSWFASTLTDGLETALTPTYIKTDKPLHEPNPLMVQADRAQARLAPVPNYGKPVEAAWPNVSGWTLLAGVGGSLLSLVLVYLVAIAIRKRQPAPAEDPPPSR